MFAAPTPDEPVLDVTIQARAGPRVGDQERTRLIAPYPTLRAMSRQLRLPEARYAGPALVFRPVTAR